MYKDVLDPSRKSDRRRLYVSHILSTLNAASLVSVAALLNPNTVVRLAKQFAKFRRFERKNLEQAMKRLEKRGMVRRQKRDDGNEYLLLTEAGKKEFLYEKQRELKLFHPPKWDHSWRVVIFDIRENKKTVRDAIRRHLGDLGFYHLQKSIFVTPHPCKDEIHFLKEFYEGESELYLIEATSLGEKEKEVRAFFRI